MSKRLDVKWFEGLYQVNELWQVRNKRWHIMSPWLKKDWYLNFVLTKKWVKYNFLWHRIVWYAFLEKWNNPIINHINWIKTDNRVENLEWCDNSHNQKHSYSRWRIHARWSLWKRWSKKYKESLLSKTQ